MSAFLLAIALAAAIFEADARSINVHMSNETDITSTVPELNATQMPSHGRVNSLSDQDIDDILLAVEHSKNHTTSKAVEEALQKRKPELVKKLKKFGRDFNGTVDGLSQPAQIYVASVVFTYWADMSNGTFTDTRQELHQNFDAEKTLRTLFEVAVKQFKKLDPAVQNELGDAFPLITGFVR
ncbi:hypothetical protein AAVH_38568, partial [Aphelenchoides avenae]